VVGPYPGSGAVPVAPGWMIVDNFPPWLGPIPGATPPYAQFRTGWIKIGEQFIYYGEAHANAGIAAAPAAIVYINPPGIPFGLSIATITVGETVTWLDWADTWSRDTHAGGTVAGGGYTYAPLLATRAGTPLVVVQGAIDLDINEPWAQQLPPIEALVEDARYGYTGAAARATEDINFFRAPLISADWTTEDNNARPGRQQVIQLTGADPVSAALTIMNVTVSFPLKTVPPLRQCTGRQVKPATMLDVLVTGGGDAD
jgi:hypothetical protein